MSVVGDRSAMTDRERAQQAEALRRFAEQFAGTEIDFDPELARAGAETVKGLIGTLE